MSFWTNLFGGSSKSNPYKAAAPWLDQIPGATNPYYQPYADMGGYGRELMGELAGDYRGMMGGLDNQLSPEIIDTYRQMAMNPGAYQQQLGSSFQASPGYQWNLDQQQQANNQAMAASGMLGSPQHQQFAQQLASHLADQEYNNYLGNQMNLASAGLHGLEGQQGVGLDMGYKGLQGLGNLESQNLQYGYGASNQMAQNMADYLYNRANLASGQAQDYRNRHQGMLGGVLGGFASGLSGKFL